MIEFDESEHLDSELSDDALRTILEEHGPIAKDRWLKPRDDASVRSSA